MWAALSVVAAGVCIAGLAGALLWPAQQGGTNFAATRRRDKLPGWMRLLWPWAVVMEPLARRILGHGARARLEQSLTQAGLTGCLRAGELLAVQIALAWLAGATAGIVGWLASTSIEVAMLCAPLAALLGVSYPGLWLRDRTRARRAKMARELPFVLDMATLCIEAGLNLHGALQQAASRGPQGPLREELSLALAEIRTGAPRIQALRAMAVRTGVPGLRTVVAALAQADALGMSVGPLLRAQAESLRGKRFLHAERLALEAPVKMLFPLIACIFPCTFLVIGFPILVKLMEHA